jgi:hypothetical protein
VEAAALLAAQRQQQLAQLETELVYNEVLIEERDVAIQEITHQIGEVHEIFQARRILTVDRRSMCLPFLVPMCHIRSMCLPPPPGGGGGRLPR